MTGHHKFNQLIENISPERKARIAEKTAQLRNCRTNADIEETVENLTIMQLAETGFEEWNDPEEDIYNYEA